MADVYITYKELHMAIALEWTRNYIAWRGPISRFGIKGNAIYGVLYIDKAEHLTQNIIE